MAKNTKNEVAADPMEKIANLLAALVVKDMRPEDAALLLDNIGFTSAEITKLLGVGESYVRQVRFQRKNKPKKKVQKS